MPKNAKAKREARARKERTEESYSTARMHLRAARGDGESKGVLDVVVVASVDRVIDHSNVSSRVRLDVVPSGVRVRLDEHDLGVFPAEVKDGKARVRPGVHPLSGGWSARVECAYEEPDPAIGLEGGWWIGGEVGIVPPPRPGEREEDRRYSAVSVHFNTNGSVNGWGGMGVPVHRVTFGARGVAPVVLEVPVLPRQGEESQNVVDYHRRKVLHVHHGPLPNGTDVLVELGPPLAPEGAWSPASPNFPERKSHPVPGGPVSFVSRFVPRSDGGHARLHGMKAEDGTWATSIEVVVNRKTFNPLPGAVPLREADPAALSEAARADLRVPLAEIKHQVQEHVVALLPPWEVVVQRTTSEEGLVWTVVNRYEYEAWCRKLGLTPPRSLRMSWDNWTDLGESAQFAIESAFCHGNERLALRVVE